MKKLIPIILLLFLNLFNCQFLNEQYSKSKIYSLKDSLEKGNRNAFYEIVPFLDSHKKLAEFLGYHYLETEEHILAKRAIIENSIFLPKEIVIDSISSKQFSEFLKKNNSKIKYSQEIQAFYITSIDKRKEFVEFRELPKSKFEKLIIRKSEILKKDWVKNKNIALLIQKNNPESLLRICEEFYRDRDKFNKYNRDKDEMYDLLRILIRKDIGSIGRHKSLSWDTKSYNFDNNSILNLLIYFSKNYKNFTWNDSENYFINQTLKSEKTDSISDLFEDLHNDNEAIALESFVKLSQSNPERVSKLAGEKDKNFLERTNDSIPMFPFRFLIQLSLFTEYCKQNNIDFLGNQRLDPIIEKLSSKLSFSERRKLESELIDNLKIEDITPLEYWTLIYQKKLNLQESVSRILDIYYTKNWSKILNDNQQLKLYLKKSLLFSRIGINGNLNYYAYKFMGNGSLAVEILNNIKTENPDLENQIIRIKKLCLQKLEYPIDDKKISNANFNSQKINIKDEVDKIRIISKDEDDFRYNILTLFSKIGYSQIPEAIKFADKIKFEKVSFRDKYSFLERDFGFFNIENWNSEEIRKDFLSIYQSHTEKQLYEYYLDKAGVDYKNNDGRINYDKIYEILKFNIIYPYTGSNIKENEVGAIIKILELNEKTRLGYPDKLCNSAGIYICTPTDRAWEWQKYLNDNKLLKQEHSYIVSFNYGYYLDKVVQDR
ncbi:hypothetical protein SAMN05444409_3902 [Epilithonimonas zeae]|uniref:Uncharacterized protein n=1 Tax=Epilithonimonas zeae TaxID=1416779 RepID=A0A1N6JUY9_9FLAO|nr:hypothetical protein SAMN05444409_3902 [Epilithonimonas zeae]